MTNSSTYDVVVIGGGHNGLAAAATLAKKGKSVCVIEKSDAMGGMARNVAMGEGVSAPQIAHLLHNLNPKVAKELGLGDLLKGSPLPTTSLSADGNHVVVEGAMVRFADGTTHPDVNAYAKQTAQLRKFAGLLGQLSTKSPPKLDGGLTSMAALGELAGLAKLGLNVKMMGKKDMREFLRVVLTNVYDLVLDEMPDGPLAGMICADAVRGNYVGPRSPGTVFNLMYRLGTGGEVRMPKGGMGAVARAFEAAATKAGCDLRTGSGVARVNVEADKVTGIVLEDGTEIATRAVLSSAAPMATMKMAGIEHFDVEAARRIKNMRCKGTVAKLNLVLKSAPQIEGLSAAQMAGRLLIAPSAETVERSFNPVKYNELPTAPVVEAVIPTLSDPELASGGRHILSAVIQHVPHTPTGGWNDANRQQVIDTVVAQLEAHMPGLSSTIEEAQLLTPSDIEDLTGAPGGHWHHAEMGVDQILTVRPVNGLAHYRFAVGGLYLCGAAAHPGGDVTGVPGRNSAMQLLKDGVLS
ncbi:Phytoene dehydrogenase-related protein [Shimia gijangensis]|uniref:Pyridine nucleotide-disulfide oxidoreductase domain-containing protein 2 n=1 Tax=Shimia gijangensis TaxID=1470563 RepID=A0A1M6GGK0_9RHOB|nr:NAD(P)/FAD-dependent oxidoreductase [Shimia gijangensis]SHJ09075.1 Phytoene dehydrogenase-related protein [Shimia gijangensis]